MSDRDPTIRMNPARPLTHQEMVFDFVDFEPNTEFSVAITGPISQAYEADLKTDGIGQAQLIWRTQAAGDYTVKTRGGEKQSESFTVSYQEGEEDMIARGILADDRDVKTVADPDSATPKTKAAAKPQKRAARRTSRSK